MKKKENLSLEQFCKQIGMSDQDLADRFGVDRSHINRIRRKVARPGGYLAYQIYEWAEGKISIRELLNIS